MQVTTDGWPILTSRLSSFVIVAERGTWLPVPKVRLQLNEKLKIEGTEDHCASTSNSRVPILTSKIHSQGGPPFALLQVKRALDFTIRIRRLHPGCFLAGSADPTPVGEQRSMNDLPARRGTLHVRRLRLEAERCRSFCRHR